MKASLITFFAFGGLFASSIANPLGASQQLSRRQDDDDYSVQGAILEELLNKVQVETAQINATLEAVPESPTAAQSSAAVEEVGTHLEAITDLVTEAASTISKRAFISSRNWGKDDIFSFITHLLWEILCVVKFLLFKLGLKPVLFYLYPLIHALVGLLKSLDKVVGSLLFAVKEIVNELLKAVGLGLLGIL